MLRRVIHGLLAAVLTLACAGRVAAESASTEEAKALFLDGKKEYERQKYEAALHLFERSYQVSARPALLFNMAACLQALDRPREAAARLRDYLNRVPNEPTRAAIEDSIGDLKERAIEQEAAAHAEREATGKSESDRAALEERIRLLEERLGTSAAPHRSRRNLAIGLGVAAGILVVTAVGLGLGLGLHGQETYTPSSFGGGPLRSTP